MEFSCWLISNKLWKCAGDEQCSAIRSLDYL
jgi:hypothetical protein